MKIIRTGVYGLLKVEDKFLVIKKGRGPFTGLYDLPGGKIEHGESNREALKREISEETGLESNEFIIRKLLTVEEDFVKHIWQGEAKDEHIIAIVYIVEVHSKDFSLEFIEKDGDACGLKLISGDDTITKKTNILTKVLDLYKTSK